MVRITILYDNTTTDSRLQSAHGFACLVEADNKRILFDTGAEDHILIENMDILAIDPKSVDTIFISHNHWDHTGGLSDFINLNRNVTIYVPSSCPLDPSWGLKTVTVTGPCTLSENIISSGELGKIEQSLFIKTAQGVVVVVGCSHPGVGNILKAAARYGKIYAIIGGLHGFDEFDLLKDIPLVCATHCTIHIAEIQRLFPAQAIAGGAGKVIEIGAR